MIKTRSLLAIKKKIGFALSFDWLFKQQMINDLTNAAISAKGVLLDVGCGLKPYKDIFIPHVARYIGFDLPVYHSVNKSGKDVDVYADALAFPFKDECFDSILSTQLLEHIPEPDVTVSEMSRVLKKGGYLILTAPLFNAEHEIPHDYFRYTRYGLTYLLSKNGFEVKYIKPQLGFWGMLGQTFCLRMMDISNTRILLRINQLICFFIQRFFYIMDKINFVDRYNLNFIAVAEKMR